MERKKLLIAESTEEFTSALANHLQGMFHIRTCQEGNQTLELIKSYRPDILVLDLMLPGLDGLSILQAAAAAEQRPMVLAVTRFASDYVLESLTRIGVGYIMMKPCDIQATASRVLDLTQQMKGPLFAAPDTRTAASNILLSLGVRTKLKGYTNLREAIHLKVKEPELTLTKELYPAVGKLSKSSGQQVERAIRGAINSAWERRDEQVWRMYFQPAANGHVPRPTNGAFISRLADCLITGTDDLETGSG